MPEDVGAATGVVTRSERRHLRCAVVGAGRWGRNLVRAVDDLLWLTDVVTTGSSSSARWLRQAVPEATPTRDLAEVLTSGRCEAVVVATPWTTHFEIARQALDAGLHVFVEKPICGTVDEAVEIRELALASDLELFVGYVHLFDPSFVELVGLVADDGVQRVVSTWNRPGLAGHAVHELLPHDIAILVQLLSGPVGDPVVRAAAGDLLDLDVHGADGATASLRYTTDPSLPKSKEVQVWSGPRRFRWSPGRLHERVPATRAGSRWRSIPVPTLAGNGASATPVEREIARFSWNTAQSDDRMVHSADLLLGVTGVVAAAATA